MVAYKRKHNAPVGHPAHNKLPASVWALKAQEFVLILRFTLMLFCLIANPVMAQAQASKFLTVNGVQLEYLDSGAGSHTLVIESGVGMGLAYWLPLLADFSTLNIRTVIYSRAGNGKSQPATDVSLTASNQRLEKLLTSIHAKENLILLGHSYGGLHVRTFASAYPDRIKGLLLLDPSHEMYESELIKYNAGWAKRDTTKLNSMMKDQPEWAHLQEVYLKKVISDHDVANQIPAVIVTSSKLNESDWWIGHSAEGKKIWRNLHQSLIRNNPNSTHIVTDQTGHNVPHENKVLVLNSIGTLLGLINGVNRARQ